MSSRFSRVGTIAIVGLMAASLSGCAAVGSVFGLVPASEVTATPTPTATVAPFESEFTDMGAVHPASLIGTSLNLNLDMWTEQKTHEWTANSEKLFSLVIDALDTTVPAEAAFALKRQVFMSNVTVTGTPVTADGTEGTPIPLINVDPIAATLDPEALRSVYGLLITSPKGGFQLESTDIGPLEDGVTGIIIDVKMTITAESAGGSAAYAAQVVEQQIPVAIFTDAEAAKAAAESSDGEN
jgi:hypothetical protein